MRCEILGRAAGCIGARGGELLTGIGRCKPLRHFAVHLGDDVARRSRRGEQPARGRTTPSAATDPVAARTGGARAARAVRRAHLARRDAPPDDCEIWGVLPDEFRAAAADLLR